MSGDLHAGQGEAPHAVPHNRPKEPTDLPHLRPLRRPSSNLPFLFSSFIGRAQELVEIKQLLVNHRLLTLTGPGGCGKTRLALAVAAELVDHFADGVMLVEFAALADATLVPQAVLTTLGVHEQPERAVTETLVDALRPKHLLLLLDNCEHLIAACAVLLDTLLRACSYLHILATSREALRLAGEIAWVVPSLSVPDAQPLPPLEHLRNYDAVRLFLDRAAEVMSTFTLTTTNASAIVQVCRQLDGIPLAIELAAARVPLLSVEQIASRLGHAFRLLTSGSRTAPQRQQTLRATIDWSYALLSEPERILFRRLAVFAGGCTLEAVEEICAGEGLVQEDILELLAQLVRRSLLVVLEDGSEARYRLLETIRQYAGEHLEHAGEAAGIRRQHAVFFLASVERAVPKLRSAERHVWLARLERMHDNLRAALGWTREEAETELGLRLAGPLLWFWYYRGYLSEARSWLEGALALPGAAGYPRAQAETLFGTGAAAFVQGDHVTAQVRLEDSVTRWREVGEKRGLAYALALLGTVTNLQGGYEAGCGLEVESQTLFREVKDQWGLALALFWLGDIHRSRHTYAAARSCYEESQALFREAGDMWGCSLGLQGLGVVAYHQHDYPVARARLEENLLLRRAVGDKWVIAESLATLGAVVQAQGDYGGAAACFEEGLTLYQDLGDRLGIPHLLHKAGEMAQMQGHALKALACFQERLRFLVETVQTERIPRCLERIASVAESEGQLVRAATLLGVVDRLLEAGGAAVSSTDRAELERNVAAVHAKLGASDLAAAWAKGQAMTLEYAIAFALAAPDLPETPTSNAAGAHLAFERTRPTEETTLPLRCFALGQERVERGPSALLSADWTYARVKELLFYLLCYPSRTREQIGLDFWPDAWPARLRSNVNNTVYHLRRALGEHDWIRYERERYAFNRQRPYWFDVDVFESSLAQAYNLQTSAPEEAIRTLQEALTLYQGDFLESFRTGEWSLARRDALRQEYLEGLLTLGSLLFAEGHYAQAAKTYRQAISRDRSLEAAHRELMQCYAAQGAPSQALLHYQELVNWLREELGAPPSPETRALFERLRRGEAL